MASTAACGRPRWAKLSPIVTDLVPIARAARRGGAEAVTLVNTVLAVAIDPSTGSYRIGSASRGGGLSGPAIHPVDVQIGRPSCRERVCQYVSISAVDV